MSEISKSFCCLWDDLYPNKRTLSKMYCLEKWKYIDDGILSGDIIKYDTNVQSKLIGSANIIIYYDKKLDVYTECHPWTGSLYRDITVEEFKKYNL
jgi:hypothetical protein